MQEIKFRALRATTNTWVYGVNKPVEATINTPTLFRMSKFWELVEVGQFKRSTISQFIGRYDINKKEIYGGDISNLTPKLPGLSDLAEVYWNEEYCKWEYKRISDLDFVNGTVINIKWEPSEIIGSRVLNPKLLIRKQ